MLPLAKTKKWLLLLSLPLFLLLTLKIEIILHKITLIETSLISINSTQIEASYIKNYIRIIIITMVAFISINVLFFSNYYLADTDEIKFYLVLISFIASIIVFSLSNNTIRLLLGWDGLGISRFILVAHYPTPTAAGSSIITIFTNRIGDVIIILRFYFFITQANWNLNYYNTEFMGLLLLITASATKRAHIPFNLWLPEAIAAPTPVSALVHSSTLVTAGIILILRLREIKNNINFINFVWIIGLLTTLRAGMVASYIKDPKKIIAYSTMSQLGIISLALGISLPFVAFFHLVTHAIFKALIFISIGVIIAQTKHKQIIESNKSTLWSSPSTAFKIATISLNAFPFTAGFYSKDLILESILSYWSESLILITFLPVSLTALYRVRLLKLTSTSNSHSPLTLPASLNTHAISKINFLSKTLQTTAAILTGRALTSILLPQSLHHITQTQTLSILMINIIGLFLLLTKLSSSPHPLIKSNVITRLIYTNISTWPTVEKINLYTFVHSFKLYKNLESGALLSFIKALFYTFRNLSLKTTAHSSIGIKMIIVTPILLSLTIIAMVVI